MHLRIVTPIVNSEFGQHGLDNLRALLRPTTKLDEVSLEAGPASIETELDEALAVPGMLQRVAEAERDGCDGVILNCVGDPGLAAARELVRIAVIGPGQSGMHLAAMLGGRFSVLIASERGIPSMEALAARYDLRTRLASVRPVAIPVLELEQDQQRLVEALAAQALAARREDRAEAIVLGSTGMVGIAPRLTARLSEAGQPMPVVDPLVAAVLLAEAVVAAGLGLRDRAGDERSIDARRLLGSLVRLAD